MERKPLLTSGGYLGDTLLDILDHFEKKQIAFSGDYYLFEPVKEICDEAKKISGRFNVHYCNLCAGNENCYAKAGDVKVDLIMDYGIEKIKRSDLDNDGVCI